MAYVDEGIKIKDIGLMYGFNSFSIIGSYTALANLISRPRLMSAPIELLSETLKLTLPFVAEIEILFYSVAQYTEKFRKNARREGLNPDHILAKASAIEIGTKNIKEKIEKKKGLRWELLRKKLHTCSSTTSLSLSK